MARRFYAGITLALCLLVQGGAIAAPAAAAPQEVRQPAWIELSAEQKQILAPVSGEWDNMPAIQRKRLLGVAKRYPKMKPQEQQRIQRRLKGWSELTPEQRALAREKYEKLKKLPPEKRQEVQKKWQEYQQLPEEKKEQLRRSKAKENPVPLANTGLPKTPQEAPKGGAAPVATPPQTPAAN